MAGPLVTDEFWAVVSPWIPQDAERPKGGRTPASARAVLTAILFVLKTGIAWKDLPQDAFQVSYRTCQRRFRLWSDLNIWSRIHQTFLQQLQKQQQLNNRDVLIDTSPVKAPRGGQKPAPIPRINHARVAKSPS